jgi:hypothetical protein
MVHCNHILPAGPRTAREAGIIAGTIMPAADPPEDDVA